MKILFNPSVSYLSPIKKQTMANNINQQKTTNASYLNCIANYNLAFCSREKAIYSVDFDGNTKKFNTILEASNELGISNYSICEILAGKKQSCQGYTFLEAAKIEKKDENGEYLRNKNGEIKLEQGKIKKAREAFLFARTNYPVIEIASDGKVTIFKSINEAVNSRNLQRSSICCAVNKGGSCSGSLYMKLADFVLIGKNGNVVYQNNGKYKLDEEKIELYKLVAASN